MPEHPTELPRPAQNSTEQGSFDTIAAVSTPPGRGGIGIVRLAGPSAFPIAHQLVDLSSPLEHARARFARVRDPADAPHAPAAQSRYIDDAIVTAYLAPRSYTGDDLVEIAAHGSPVVLDAILSAALERGARLAAPGEFTQRAFLAGRLDLTQAEAVHDLIAAHTLEQARAAAQQLGGALSRRISPAKELLLRLIALLEAGMDFASGELDDVESVAPEFIAEQIVTVHATLAELARSYRAGSLLRSGASLALVGPPNAGKSSLFNQLLERPRAIVTPMPGTTRDTVEEVWSLAGIPIRLIDTAGLRPPGETPADEAERQGIERSREALADADLVLLVHDANTAVGPEEASLAHEITGRPHLRIFNKIDLLPSSSRSDPPTSQQENAALFVSALTGQGLQELQAAMLRELQKGGGLAQAGALNTRRQYEAVLAALDALGAAGEANQARLPHEILLLDLHNALRSIDLLTGQTTADDILARIFSTFCIGK